MVDNVRKLTLLNMSNKLRFNISHVRVSGYDITDITISATFGVVSWAELRLPFVAFKAQLLLSSRDGGKGV